jgi:hypothetical protein
MPIGRYVLNLTDTSWSTKRVKSDNKYIVSWFGPFESIATIFVRDTMMKSKCLKHSIQIERLKAHC